MRKLLGIVIVLLLANASMHAQQIDTSYQSTYYGQKASLFRLLPDTKGEIIFLGNSITDIGEWVEIWQNPKVKNRGISGDNTFGVLARLDEVVSSKPEKVFLMIGINDIARDTPDSVIVGNIIKIVEAIKAASPKTKLIVQSILPTNDAFTEFKRHQNKDGHIRTVNSALRNYCQQHQLVFVDLYPLFLNGFGKLDERYTNDGLHINGAGYMLWRDTLRKLKLL